MSEVASEGANVTITLTEQPAREWWSAARRATDIPVELEPLLAGESEAIEISNERARDLRVWCTSLPGWDSDPDRCPISFDGLLGRRPTARRSTGIRINVRLSVDEQEALVALGATRGQTSLADIMRSSALLDAKRESTRMIDGVDTAAATELVAVEMLVAGDLVYSDAANAPSLAGPVRVLALRQEHDICYLELAGAPAWVVTGTRIRRHRP